MMTRRTARSLVALVALAFAPLAVGADDALWALLRSGGQVVLVRHAQTTPGVGDPAGMKLEDCATQRNLSDEGRREAAALGETFRLRGVPIGALASSPWCRCLETARLAFRQEPRVDASLSNLFGRHEREATQVAALKKLVGRVPERGNLVLVTHGSTISALTGVSPAMGEVVVITPQQGGGFKVQGRLR